MFDLAIITATVARERVAERFAGPAVTDRPAATAARRAAVRALRAAADRLEPAPETRTVVA